MPRPRSRIRYENLALPRPPTRPVARVVPTVDPWVAGEMFVSQHAQERARGFAILQGAEAARRSLLTIQLLASRLDEPDLGLRTQIVQALADYFELRGSDYRYPAEVRAAVAAQLRKFDRSQLLALLEAHQTAQAGAGRLTLEGLTSLLERVPGASGQLVRIANDRSLAIHLRQAAVELLGKIGFTDAADALESLAARIAGRQAGQLAMAFAPTDYADEGQLLPALHAAVAILREN